MSKKLVLGLLLVLFVGLSAGQSLQDFEYSPEDGFEKNLAGGEGFNQSVNFSNAAERPLPLAVRVVIDSEDTEFVSIPQIDEQSNGFGAEPREDLEFYVKGVLISDGEVRRLGFKPSLNDGDLVYLGRFRGDADMLGAGSDNSLKLEIDSDPRIRPDNFSFEFDVRSKAGFATESKSTEVENGKADVTVGNNSVSVNTENGANVTVESYNETTVSPPSGSEFVGGVGVEVTDGNQDEAEANGTVSIGYSQARIDSRGLDEDTMNVYYFNESRGGWTTEGLELVSRDTEENVVRANASHFSTYAAFAEPEPQDSEEESESDPVVFNSGFGSEETQQTSQDNETQSEQPPSDDETDQEPVDDGTNESEDTGESQEPETDEPGQPQNTGQTGPTGLFTAESGSVVGGLLVVLVAVIGYLQYAGRIELGNALSYLSRD